MRHKRGKLFVISGPSGAGKSTVIGKVQAARDDLYFSVSATTRERRNGEEEGINYYYVNRERFQEMIENDELLEHVCFVGNYYGTPIIPIIEHLGKGHSVILDVEPRGASNVKKFIPDAISIYLSPSTFATLEQRLRSRGHDTDETIQKRLRQAKIDHVKAMVYDYIIINDDLDVAVNELEAIITAELCRTADRIDFIEKV